MRKSGMRISPLPARARPAACDGARARRSLAAAPGSGSSRGGRRLPWSCLWRTRPWPKARPRRTKPKGVSTADKAAKGESTADEVAVDKGASTADKAVDKGAFTADEAVEENASMAD